MVSSRINRSLITGTQSIITYNGRNPQPVIGKDSGAAVTLGHAVLFGSAPSRH
jgi:hypothetical protein